MRLDRRGLGAWRWSARAAASLVLLIVLAVLALLPGARRLTAFDKTSTAAPHLPATRPSPFASQHVLSAFGRLPLTFERNQGQSDSRVKFLARGSGYGVFLTPGEAVIALRRPGNAQSAARTSVVRMALAGASPKVEPVGAGLLPGKTNYFIGNDPSRWHPDVPLFAQVRYPAVYPGIDLLYHGNQGQIEYDFELAPGSNANLIQLAFRGARTVGLDAEQNLVLALDGQEIRLQAPRAYQRSGNQEQAVAARFELRADNRVGFQLGPYDRGRPLVIDPILTYSTYLGGSGNEGCSVITGSGLGVPGCPAVVVDTGGNAYIVGSTESTDFPLPAGGSPFQSTLKGVANIFIAKFNSNATILQFATYLGGDGTDISAGAAIDSVGNVFVAGTTDSSNFPTNGANTAFQAKRLSAGKHAFVSQVDSAGHTLLYSTYLSGTGEELGTGVALDPLGDVYITGTTTSREVKTGFPSTVGALQTAPASGSSIQFFISKLDPHLSGVSSMVYSTYFGGGNPANGRAVGGGIAVDSNSNAYITGGTNFLHVGASNDFPILNAYQGCLDSLPSVTSCPSNVSALDAFVAELDPAAATGAQLVYSTYFGGSAEDIGYAIAVDAAQSTYVTGSTASTNFVFPAGVTAFQGNNAGGTDAFLAKFGLACAGVGCINTGVPLTYFTYIGGSQDEAGLAVAVDSNQGARVTGWTTSPDFPFVNNPVQSGPGGGTDAFVARIDTTATAADTLGNYATYLGGGGSDFGTGIAVDIQGASYVAGETSSANFPLASPFQGGLNGSGTDAFLSKLGPVLDLSITATGTPSPVGVGNQVSFAYTITNNADFTNGIVFSDTLVNAAQATFISATTSAGTCGSASGGAVLCNIGALNAGAPPATVTVVVVPTVAGVLGNSGSVSVTGTAYSNSANPSVAANDYSLTIAPTAVTLPAGNSASLTATVTPTGYIPDSVELACGAGLPTGATCTFTTNPFPNLSNGSASTDLVISTTARVTTTTRLWHSRPVLLACLSLPGLGLLMGGFAGRNRGSRRALLGLLLGGFFTLSLLQAGCGSSSSVSTTTGTPAGTYSVTVDATSGSAVRSSTIRLVVQ